MGPADLFGFLLVVCLSLHFKLQGLEGADVWTIEGDSPVLPCGITYDPNVNLFWTLQPETIILLLKHPRVGSSQLDWTPCLHVTLSNGTVEVREDPFKGRVEFVDGKSLKIRNVSRQDDSSAWGGEYQCSQRSRTGERSHLHARAVRAKNPRAVPLVITRAGTPVSNIIAAQVGHKDPPSRVAITGYNSSSTLHPGDELQLTCNASDSNPEPSYSWFKNGQKISSESTLTFDPIKLENNGDIIICKVNLRDANRPVFEWEGESERISLSVTVDEPGDDTTVDGPGNGVNVGLAVGLSVAAVVGLAAIIPIVYVIVKKFRDTDTPTPSVSVEDGLGSSANGTIPMSQLPSGQNGAAIPAAPGEGESSEGEHGDTEDGLATGEFGIGYAEEPLVPPGNTAEPEPTGGSDTGDSAQDGLAGPQTHPSNGAEGSLPFPVTVSSPEVQPPQPESTNSTVWPDIFDTVKENLRAKYRPELARALGLTETEIAEIEEDVRNAHEKLHQVLVLWREKNPSATPQNLATALRKCKCNAVAHKVEQCWLGYDRR
ncbi:hypothetical protein Bbelb_248990 [Branchiostoma belcheri]|nr:hypothetical protein Bbelb_248990 [Branchiostoma belcheri]